MGSNKKIIIGTWPLSGDYGHISASEVEKILNFSLLKNFIEFDTAPSYGNGFIEHMIGNVFSGEKKILLNTKFGNFPFEGKNFNLGSLKKSVDQSLKRLKVDSINILFLHNPRLKKNEYKQICNFMDNLKKNKVIKYKGISLAKNHQYDENILKRFDVIQDDANLLSTNFKIYKNHKLYGRSPFANGILAGSLMKKFALDDHRSQWLNKPERKKIIKESVNQLSKITNLSLKKLAFFFVYNNKFINKNIFGIKSVKHIQEILRFLSISPPKNINLLRSKIYELNNNNFGVKKDKIKNLF